MEDIRILPHHARFYFEAYYFKKSPKDTNNWNENSPMKRNGVRAIKRVLRNPDQMVRIARDYDEFCRMCPRNPEGTNYSNEWRICDSSGKIKNSQGELEIAKLLGLEGIVDGQPITSAFFLQLMEPTYKRLAEELEKSPNASILDLLYR